MFWRLLCVNGQTSVSTNSRCHSNQMYRRGIARPKRTLRHMWRFPALRLPWTRATKQTTIVLERFTSAKWASELIQAMILTNLLKKNVDCAKSTLGSVAVDPRSFYPQRSIVFDKIYNL